MLISGCLETLVVKLSRKLRLLGLISVTWGFNMIQGSFSIFSTCAATQASALQFKELKSQGCLCSFSRKVNSAYTHGKMLHTLPGRSLGKLFFPCGIFPFFNFITILCEFVLWVLGRFLGFFVPFVLFPWAAGWWRKDFAFWVFVDLCWHGLYFSFRHSFLFFLECNGPQQEISFWVRYTGRRAGNWKNRRGGNFIIGSSSWIHLII